MNIEQLKELQKQQANRDGVADAIKKARAEFEETISGTIVIMKHLNEGIAALKADITLDALEEFKETGIKKLSGGIGIREKSKIEYCPKKALSFAKEKDMFLQLNKSAFDKAAASMDLDWVISTKEATVTYPKEIKI